MPTTEIEDLKSIHALSLRLTHGETLTDVLRTAAALVDAQLGAARPVTPDGKHVLIGHIGFGDDVLDRCAIVTLEECTTGAVALG